MGGPLFANANRVFVQRCSLRLDFSTLMSAWPLFIILLLVQSFSLNLDRRRSCRHDLFLVSSEKWMHILQGKLLSKSYVGQSVNLVNHISIERAFHCHLLCLKLHMSIKMSKDNVVSKWSFWWCELFAIIQSVKLASRKA